MGFPQFNLTTLQLVAPTANMTKAEYKAAYGIDLDETNIKAFKLVLFGGEKYAIDQIKEVEDGIEIYFNGRIMSITDIVQVSGEVYDVANSKPIYCHPINFGDNKDVVTCLIFNNSPTPFTPSTFADWILDLYEQIGETIRIMASGAFDYSGNGHIASFIGVNQNGILLYGLKTDDLTQVNKQIGDATAFVAYVVSFNDGVNKIN